MERTRNGGREARTLQRPDVLLPYTDQQRRATWTTRSVRIQKGMPHSVRSNVVISNVPCAERY